MTTSLLTEERERRLPRPWELMGSIREPIDIPEPRLLKAKRIHLIPRCETEELA
jgi:hypothetical protein